MAGKISDAANNMFSSIGAIQTLVENFPMNLITFKDLKFATSFDVLAILFKILGVDREEIIEIVTHALCGGMKETSDGSGFISQVEEIVKLALEANISSILNCTTNPIISNNLLDEYVELGTKKSGEGISLNVSEVDFTGVLSRSPFFEDGKKFYFDVENYDPTNLYNSKDFNAFLWYIINKSDKSQPEKLIWDNRYRAKIYGEGNGKHKEIIRCTYTDGKYPKSDILTVQICGARENNPANYYKTRKLAKKDGTNWALNKTIFEFNHDFLTSIKLYEPKVIIAEIIEYLLGTGNISLNLGFSINEEIIQGKIQQIIKNVIENDDFKINDCYFSFSNEEYNNMLETAERNRYNMITNGKSYYEVNPSDILSKLSAITSNSTLIEDKAVISSALTDVMATPAQDPSASLSLDINYDWSFELMRALVYPFIRPLFTPKVIFLLMVNKKIMGSLDDTLKIDIESLLSDLLSIIIKDIIIKLKDLILDMFLTHVLKKLSPLLGLLVSRLLLETLKMYKDLLVQIFKCITVYKFGTNFTNGLVNPLDNVNYADIEIKDIEKTEPEQTIC